MDQDGLLAQGGEGMALTWMDAQVNEYPVTPRSGKPVEINALWYNAVKIMEYLAHTFNDTAHVGEYTKLANKIKKSFNREFWNEKTRRLYDYIDFGRKDTRLRPNQLFAISLPFSVLDESRHDDVLDYVTEHLLTPYGLRTLAPFEDQYVHEYIGNQQSRDHAYHQGTVWPWLLGAYISAYVKVHGKNPQTQEDAKLLIEPLITHLSTAGLGSISEIFDGEAPHTPRGCIAQAWSVGELLRVLHEDIG